MKGTTISNWSHGPYQAGTLQFTAQEAIHMRIRDVATQEWLEEQSEQIARDQGISEHVLTGETVERFFLESFNRRPDFDPKLI